MTVVESCQRHPAFLHAALAVLVLSACAAGDAPRQVSMEDTGDLPQLLAAKDRDLGQRVLRCGEHDLKARLKREHDPRGPAAIAAASDDGRLQEHVDFFAVRRETVSALSSLHTWAQRSMPPPAV